MEYVKWLNNVKFPARTKDVFKGCLFSVNEKGVKGMVGQWLGFIVGNIHPEKDACGRHVQKQTKSVMCHYV